MQHAATHQTKPSIAAFIDFVDSIPTGWVLTPVAGKAPIVDQWQTKQLSKSELLAKVGNEKVTGLGLIFGTSTSLIGIDHDGESCDDLIVELSGIPVSEALPNTISVTSGRPGRYTLIYKVPEKYHTKIENRSIPTGIKTFNEYKNKEEKEQLEFRWSGTQSVIFGIHPNTQQPYQWINSPNNTQIAECPMWVIALVAGKGQSEKKPNTSPLSEDEERAKAEKLLNLIDPNQLDWHQWRNCLLAAHYATVDRDTAWGWSERHNEADETRFNDIWNHIKNTGEVLRETGTLFFHATQQGWVPENKGGKSRIDEIISACNPWLKIYDEGTTAGKIKFWYYSASKKHWCHSYNPTIITGLIEAFCNAENIQCNVYKAIDAVTGKTIKIDPIAKALTQMVKNESDHLASDPIQNTNVIAFNNTCYNTQTNERIPHSPEIGNHSVFPFDMPDEIPESWGKPFIDFNQAWCKTDTDAKLLLFVWAIGARQCAGNYMLICHLVGSTQIGKTQFARSIVYPYCDNLDQYSKYIAQVPCKVNGKPSEPNWNTIRRSSYVAYLDEMYDYTQGIDSIKEAGNTHSTFLINEKYKPIYTLPRRFPILAASETAPRMAHNFNEGVYNRLYFIDLLHWSNTLMQETEFSSGVSMMDKLKQTYLDVNACRKYFFWCLVHLNNTELDKIYQEIITAKSELKKQIIENNTGIATMSVLLEEHYTITLNPEHYAFVSDIIDRYHTVESIESSQKTNEKFRLTTKGFNAKLEGYLQSIDHPLYIKYQQVKDKVKIGGKLPRKRNPKTGDIAPVIYGIKEIPSDLKSF
jgi:Bifunctional DNA primase/polymerase, N-terminal